MEKHIRRRLNSSFQTENPSQFPIFGPFTAAWIAFWLSAWYWKRFMLTHGFSKQQASQHVFLINHFTFHWSFRLLFLSSNPETPDNPTRPDQAGPGEQTSKKKAFFPPQLCRFLFDSSICRKPKSLKRQRRREEGKPENQFAESSCVRFFPIRFSCFTINTCSLSKLFSPKCLFWVGDESERSVCLSIHRAWFIWKKVAATVSSRRISSASDERESGSHRRVDPKRWSHHQWSHYLMPTVSQYWYNSTTFRQTKAREKHFLAQNPLTRCVVCALCELVRRSRTHFHSQLSLRAVVEHKINKRRRKSLQSSSVVKEASIEKGFSLLVLLCACVECFWLKAPFCVLL